MKRFSWKFILPTLIIFGHSLMPISAFAADEKQGPSCNLLLRLAVQQKNDQAALFLMQNVPELHPSGDAITHLISDMIREGVSAQVLAVMLDGKRNLSAVDKTGRTPLQTAKSVGRADIIELLKKYGLTEKSIEVGDFSVLELTREMNRIGLTKRQRRTILEENKETWNYNPELGWKSSETGRVSSGKILRDAVVSGETELVKFLITRKGLRFEDASSTFGSEDVNSRMRELTYYAVKNQNYDVVSFMVQNGILKYFADGPGNINDYKSNLFSASVLPGKGQPDNASKYPADIKMLQILLANGVANTRLDWGVRELIGYRQDTSVLRLLFENDYPGRERIIEEIKKQAILGHLYFSMVPVENLRYLHQNGVDVSQVLNDLNITFDTMKVLVTELGANVNVLNYRGNPPIFRAIETREPNMAHFLIQHGANTSLKSAEAERDRYSNRLIEAGTTAEDYAKIVGFKLH